MLFLTSEIHNLSPSTVETRSLPLNLEELPKDYCNQL